MTAFDRSHVEKSLNAMGQAFAELSRLPPGAEKSAQSLIESLLDLHGLAISALATSMTSTPQGAAEFERLAEAEPLRAILLLHGLHPIASEIRARHAVDRMRPEVLTGGCYLGPVEIVSGVLRVRLHGRNCVEIRQLLEDAILDAAPDLSGVAIELSGVDEAAPNRIST